MTGVLRFGLIGAGSIAGYHVDGLRAAGGEVAAIAAGSRASAEKAAQTFAISRACDWRAMLSDGGIDAVIVATPDDTHEEIAIAAIDAGSPAWCRSHSRTNQARRCGSLVIQPSESFLGTSFMHRHFPRGSRSGGDARRPRQFAGLRTHPIDPPAQRDAGSRLGWLVLRSGPYRGRAAATGRPWLRPDRASFRTDRATRCSHVDRSGCPSGASPTAV